MSGIRGCGYQDRSLVIPHNHNLLGEIQIRQGNDGSSQMFGPVFKVTGPIIQTAGQNNLDDIVFADIGAPVEAGAEFPPEPEVPAV